MQAAFHAANAADILTARPFRAFSKRMSGYTLNAVQIAEELIDGA
jgi:hypothetical protein